MLYRIDYNICPRRSVFPITNHFQFRCFCMSWFQMSPFKHLFRSFLVSLCLQICSVVTLPLWLRVYVGSGPHYHSSYHGYVTWHSLSHPRYSECRRSCCCALDSKLLACNLSCTNVPITTPWFDSVYYRSIQVPGFISELGAVWGSWRAKNTLTGTNPNPTHILQLSQVKMYLTTLVTHLPVFCLFLATPKAMVITRAIFRPKSHGKVVTSTLNWCLRDHYQSWVKLHIGA